MSSCNGAATWARPACSCARSPGSRWISPLAPEGDFVDAATGAVYDILGRPSGSAGASALEAVEHLDTFWFAAAAFYPDAAIIGR